MNATLLAPLSVLFTLFSIIGGFIAKLWWDERQNKRRAEVLLDMGINERDNQARSGKHTFAFILLLNLMMPGGSRGGRPAASMTERQDTENASGDEEEDGIYMCICRWHVFTTYVVHELVLEEDLPGTGSNSAQFGRNIGKKKLAKLQAKAEAKAQREQVHSVFSHAYFNKCPAV